MTHQTYLTGDKVTVPDPYQYDSDRIEVMVLAYDHHKNIYLVLHENGYTEEHTESDVQRI